MCKLFDVSYLQVVFLYETFEIRISPCDGHQEVGHICSIVECTEYHEYLFPQNDPNQSKSMTETEFILLFFDNQVNLHSKMSIELSAIHLESEKSCFYSKSFFTVSSEM